MARFNRDHNDFPEIKARLGRAFARLRKERQFLARQNFLCCLGCATAALPNDTAAWVFYHRQDGDNLRERGQCYLAFGANEGSTDEDAIQVGQQVADFLRGESLEVEWDGTAMHRILVKGLMPPEPEATFLDLVGEAL